MEIDKSNIGALTDDQLFKALKSYNLPTGPITSTTRTIYERRLKNYLDGKSTLTKEKSLGKTSNKTPVVENLTSTTIIEKTLVEPSNKKTQPTIYKSQQTTPTININIHSSHSTQIPSLSQGETQFPTKSKILIENPVTKSSNNIYESSIPQKQHIEQISDSSKAPCKTATSINDFVGSRAIPSAPISHQRNELITNMNGPSNFFTAKTNENLSEMSTQRFSKPTDTLSYKSIEKTKDYVPMPMQTTYQISRSAVETSLKTPIENLGRQTSNTNNEVSSSSSRYETPASNLAAFNKDPVPILVPNKYSASPIINHRSSPLINNKYAERLQNYGLLDSNPLTRISTSNSSAVPLTVNYSMTPSTIRSRPAMHTPKPRETETTTFTSEISSEISVDKAKTGIINVKYALCICIVTVIFYWIFIGFGPSFAKTSEISEL